MLETNSVLVDASNTYHALDCKCLINHLFFILGYIAARRDHLLRLV